MGVLQKTVTVALEGGSYRQKSTGATVAAQRWNKDGDHALVRRYPIEGRDYKGILEVSAKERYNLRFGDWIVESDGRTYVVAAERFAADFEEIADPAAQAAPAEASA
jgi:hypothetical protein